LGDPFLDLVPEDAIESYFEGDDDDNDDDAS